MARPAGFEDHEISKFAGLDLRGPVELQPEKTLSKCINFEIGLLGELKKRPGILRQSSGGTLTPAVGGVKILGEVSNSTKHQLIAQTDETGATNGKIYRSEDYGISWVQVSTPAAQVYSCGRGCQYGGALHMMSLSGLMKWDGTTWTVYGAAAIPRSNYRAVILQDRLFCIESSTGFIRFTDPGMLDTWPAANSIGFTAEDNDLIVGIIAYRDRLVTLRQNSINVIYLNGPPSSWTVKQLPFGVGVANEDCAVVRNDLLYLLSYDGVYRTDLTQMEEISKPIHPIFRTRRMRTFLYDGKYADCMAYYNGRMICSIMTDNMVDRMMVFNINNNTWTEWLPLITGSDTYPYTPFKDMYSVYIGRRVPGVPYLKEGIYFTTANDGRVFLFDDQNLSWYDDLSGSNYTVTARTKSTDADLPSQQKRCARFSVRAHKSTGTGMTGLYSVNGVDGPTFNIPVDTTLKQTRLKGPGWFRQLAFEISDTSNSYVEVEDFVISLKKKSEITEVAT